MGVALRTPARGTGNGLGNDFVNGAGGATQQNVMIMYIVVDGFGGYSFD